MKHGKSEIDFIKASLLTMAGTLLMSCIFWLFALVPVMDGEFIL
jgi:hypothetical protein